MRQSFMCAASALTLGFCLAVPALAQDQFAPLTVTADGIGSDGYIAPDYAYCIPATKGHVQDGPDKNVGLSWSKGPDAVKSYAIIVVDKDVPTVFDDAGKEGKTIASDMKRRDFYHWVLFDIPATVHEVPAGADSNALAKNGKSELRTPYGIRGVNDYAPYMASNPDRKGVYAGYDGPCPPWNDERVHHYYFRVYGLDVPSLGLSGEITGSEAEDQIRKHAIAEGEMVGKYTLNPNINKE